MYISAVHDAIARHKLTIKMFESLSGGVTKEQYEKAKKHLSYCQKLLKEYK